MNGEENETSSLPGRRGVGDAHGDAHDECDVVEVSDAEDDTLGTAIPFWKSTVRASTSR